MDMQISWAVHNNMTWIMSPPFTTLETVTYGMYIRTIALQYPSLQLLIPIRGTLVNLFSLCFFFRVGGGLVNIETGSLGYFILFNPEAYIHSYCFDVHPNHRSTISQFTASDSRTGHSDTFSLFISSK